MIGGQRSLSSGSAARSSGVIICRLRGSHSSRGNRGTGTAARPVQALDEDEVRSASSPAMTGRVARLFAHLLDRLEPVGTELDARSKHRGTIEQGVRGAYPAISKVEVIGSHTRGTAIRRFSDVDYLAVLRRQDLMRNGMLVQSSTVLTNLRNALAKRFPYTQVRIDGPAVVVAFAEGDGAVDVVPAYWTRPLSASDGYPVYGIANGDGGWVITTPQRHSAYINQRHVKHANRLRGVLRLLKGWKHRLGSPTPFLGFHVELLLAGMAPPPVMGYAGLLRNAFRVIVTNQGRPVSDPMGVAAPVPLARTPVQRTAVQNQALAAWRRADAAIAAEASGNENEAMRLWQLVFDGLMSRL